MKQNWIIGISGSEMDDVFVVRVYGTKEQVKSYLMKQINDDRSTYKEEYGIDWDFGTENKEEIKEYMNGKMYAFGSYAQFHNDYTATPEMEVEIL